MTKKTVFFDIDGTLLGNRDGKRFQIPPSTLVALHLLIENGHEIAVCSGRQEVFIHRFFPGLFQSYVAMNGAHVVYQGKTVCDRLLETERIKRLIRHFDAFGCSYVFIGKNRGWARNVPERILYRMEEIYGLPDFLVTSWDPELIRPGMMDFVFETEDHYQKCTGAFTDSMVLNHQPGMLTNDLCFRDWDKSNGIGEYLAFSGVRKEDTVAFGDGYNDITMMKTVGCAVAMGNAVEEVKGSSDYITDSIFNDGIYHGLKHLGLI